MPGSWNTAGAAAYYGYAYGDGGAGVARRTLRARKGWSLDQTVPGTNDFGFNMKPSGRGDGNTGLFTGKDTVANFWTTTPSLRAPKTGYYLLSAWPAYIGFGEYGGDNLPHLYNVQYACRCVKD